MSSEAFYRFNVWFIIVSLLMIIAISLMYIVFFRDSDRPNKKHRHAAD